MLPETDVSQGLPPSPHSSPGHSTTVPTLKPQSEKEAGWRPEPGGELGSQLRDQRSFPHRQHRWHPWAKMLVNLR